MIAEIEIYFQNDRQLAVEMFVVSSQSYYSLMPGPRYAIFIFKTFVVLPKDRRRKSRTRSHYTTACDSLARTAQSKNSVGDICVEPCVSLDYCGCIRFFRTWRCTWVTCLQWRTRFRSTAAPPLGIPQDTTAFRRVILNSIFLLSGFNFAASIS